VGASLKLEKVAFGAGAATFAGRRVAYIGSKRKVSKASRTISIMATLSARRRSLKKGESAQVVVLVLISPNAWTK
jgi:hypothetical protein